MARLRRGGDNRSTTTLTKMPWTPRSGGSCGVETQLGTDLPVAAEVPNGDKLPGYGLKDSLAIDWLIFTGSCLRVNPSSDMTLFPSRTPRLRSVLSRVFGDGSSLRRLVRVFDVIFESSVVTPKDRNGHGKIQNGRVYIRHLYKTIGNSR
ncbi:unnamed protein product [Phytophthora lilii]|uniref:Unnamed protein product n=1 Tax=Phytophthora lilii TaxID=2077276 RepID=A0A9W6X4M9_9STRA|nr:unnamed protein product [Phytophthora lilii]